MANTMTDEELEHAVCLALGWTVKGSNPPGSIYIDDKGEKDYIQRWSRDGNAMLSLIEKMRERYWFCTIAIGEDSYEAKFHGGGGDGQEIVWSGEADTLPRAVAEAAYAALIEETND